MSDKEVKTEKSAKDRAAVLAEREAKKLAKKLKSVKISTPTEAPVIDNKLPATTQPEQKPQPNGGKPKSNAELKAERRAKQEAQRAAKTTNTKAPPPKEKPKIEPPTQVESPKPKKPITSNLGPHKAQLLFNHLLIEREAAKFKSDGIHKSIIQLGTQYQTGIILGSNARCVAMLAAIKEMLADFKTPAQEEYGRSLDTALQKCSQYLHSCRPISVSMINALRFLKFQLTLFPHNISDVDAGALLCETINTYIKEQIEKASEAISIRVQDTIENGDVILTYASSSLIQHILLDAHRNGKNFRVVVVDGRPFAEGKEMLRRLVAAGVKCTYALIATTSFIISSVNKVLLGAHALLANGYVMSRCGTAQVALMAKAHNVPVLVCCETYKFSERVQTDSFVYNELAESDKLTLKCEEKDLPPSLIPLNLTYDVTPPDLVSAVVTEVATMPCTSVPVILRIKPTDICY